MPPNDRFKLKKSAVLATLISALLPAAALGANAAGRVEFAFGDVYAISVNGTQRALARGSNVLGGDTIRTTRGRVHLRLRDGAYVSLKPNTEFRIDEYRFEKAKPKERRGFFSLLRGGLRTITGLIGKLNRKNYRVHTPVATIGIRGTHYSLEVGADGKPRQTQVVNYLDSSDLILKVNPEFALHAGGRATINPIMGVDGGEIIEVELVDKGGTKTVYHVFADGTVNNVTSGETLSDEDVAALLGTQALDPDREDLDGDDTDDSAATLEDIIDGMQNSGYGN